MEVARTAFQRMRGLLARKNLEPGGGMMLERCSCIHTFFMNFPLDIIFADGDLIVKKLVRELRPWRFAAALGAACAIELPAGVLNSAPVMSGDALRLEMVR